VPSPLTLVPTPGKDRFHLLPFTFFKCILIVQRGFALLLQVCVYRALIKLTSQPPYLLILCHHAPLIFNSIQFSALYSYIDGLFQYFSFSNIFFTYPTSCSPFRQAH
jgi:hypothetical protein